MVKGFRVHPGGGGLARVVPAYALFVLVELSIWLTLILWAFERGGPGFASLVAIVQLVPAALLAPALAALGDRFSRGTALLSAHGAVAVTTAATTLALLVAEPDGVVVAASALATTALAVVRPVHFAAVPQLAGRPEQLVRANALCSGVEGFGQFAGPLLAGVGVALSGAAAVFVAGTVLAVVATLLCLRIGLDAPAAALSGSAAARSGETVRGGLPAALREATEGLRVVGRDAPALVLVLVMTTQFVLVGALDVVGTAFATESLGLVEAAAGLLIGCIGLGAVGGALLAGRASRRPALTPVVIAGALVQGLAFASAGLLGTLAASAVAIVGSGAGAALLLVCGRTLLQRSTQDRVLARVLGVQESTSLLGLAVGAAVAPPLLDRLEPAEAFAPLGLAAAVVAVLAVRLLRRLDGRALVLPGETDLLSRVPFLALLPRYELERLARTALWRDVEAGAVLVRQGEPGAEYFVVAEGELAVDVDGTLRPHTLRPGDGFGEIALLRAVPRTATVTALVAARVLVLGAPEFLGAVTNSVDGRTVAEEVAAAHLARDAAG